MAAPKPSERQRALARLAGLSERDLADIWRKLNLSRPTTLADPLAEVLAAIVDKYGAAAATLAADWFDEARDAAGVSGSFRARPALPPDADKIAALARWGIGPLFDANPNPSDALALISGGLQRVVLSMARDTTAGSVALDPAGPTFARHASANACAFCRLVASRGPVYTSKASAERVGGRGTDVATNIGRTKGRKALGVRARGTQKLGDKYHDHCHCVAVEVWPDQPFDEAPYVAEWRQQYADALDTTKGSHGAIDLKKTLSNWREQTGAR